MEILRVLPVLTVFNKFLKIQPTTQSAFTCSKLTLETLKQGMKYVQS